MAITRVLITVKTYPTLSSRYDELVCTAGFLDNGDWIRLYPIPFRKKSYDEQYRKYDWIEIDLVKNTRDSRPESYRPKEINTEIKIVGHIGTDNSWSERKKIVQKKVYSNLSTLISEAKNPDICTSLATFKPTKILDFVVEDTSREWDAKKLEHMKQLNLFEARGKELNIVRKLPYKFSYVIEDNEGKRSKMMVEDWEIGQLYWNCLRRHEGVEGLAVKDVIKKYLDDFAKTKDLSLFLGTTQKHHYTGKNPFVIIGTFHPKFPKKENQLSLF